MLLTLFMAILYEGIIHVINFYYLIYCKAPIINKIKEDDAVFVEAFDNFKFQSKFEIIVYWEYNL